MSEHMCPGCKQGSAYWDESGGLWLCDCGWESNISAWESGIELVNQLYQIDRLNDWCAEYGVKIQYLKVYNHPRIRLWVPGLRGSMETTNYFIERDTLQECVSAAQEMIQESENRNER